MVNSDVTFTTGIGKFFFLTAQTEICFIKDQIRLRWKFYSNTNAPVKVDGEKCIDTNVYR